MAELSQLGVGGILAFLIIREVLAFLKAKKTNGSAGDKAPEFWMNEFRNIVKSEVGDAERRLSRQLDDLRPGRAR